jgi:hypothetical protein
MFCGYWTNFYERLQLAALRRSPMLITTGGERSVSSRPDDKMADDKF